MQYRKKTTKTKHNVKKLVKHVKFVWVGKSVERDIEARGIERGIRQLKGALKNLNILKLKCGEGFLCGHHGTFQVPCR